MHNMFDENAEHGKFLISVTPRFQESTRLKWWALAAGLIPDRPSEPASSNLIQKNDYLCFVFSTDKQTDIQTDG